MSMQVQLSITDCNVLLLMYIRIFLSVVYWCRLNGLKLPLGWQCGAKSYQFSWGGLASLSTHNKDAIWQSVNMTAIWVPTVNLQLQKITKK